MSAKLTFMQKNIKPNRNKASSKPNFIKSSDVFETTSKATWTKPGTQQMLLEGYEGNSWVFACIRKKMQAVGSVPLILQEFQKELGYKDFIGQHPLKKLLENPCPGVTGAQLIKIIQGQFDIQGEFFGKVTLGGKGGKVPLEVWPLHIGSTSPVVKNNEIVEFKYTNRNGSVKTIDPSEILHLKSTHPDNIFSGMAAMTAGSKAVDIDNEAAKWQKISMQNRGIPDGVFTMEGDIGPDEWEEASRQVAENYSGSDHARGPWVVANAKFEQMSQSMADLDFMQGRKMTREEICAVLDVPPPLVGILDKANYANIETARKIFWRDSMLPSLADIADQLTRRFLKSGDNLRLFFDTTNISALQDSLTEKLASAKDLFSMGVPLSVINKRLEMNLDIENVQGMNVGYLQGSLMPTTFAPSPGAKTDNNLSTIEDGENASIEGGARMSDEDFDRISSVVSKVSMGEMTSEQAAKLLKLSIPYLTDDEINGLISNENTDIGYNE